MCGIFGAVTLPDRVLAHEGLLPAMAASLHHRGPDGARLLRSARSALGATRLRIVDPTEQADQPFFTPDGRTWLVCNGEIYNAGDLRRRFAEYPYRSRTDIETILPAYTALGLDAFRELDGMFAIAIWDAATDALVLARDRAGEKPLFYAQIGQEVWFASEMQALLHHPGLRRDVDEVAVSQYLSLGYALEPRTHFAQIRRVEAGTALVFDASGVRVHRYWNPHELARSTRPAVPARESIEELRRLLDAAVRRQLVADAQIGVFLSGGLDSSLIAAIAAQAMGRDHITSFTARFEAASYDEGDWATRWARRVGTRQVDVPCGEQQLLRAVRAVSGRLAEPVSDPAILPSYLLAETAHEHVRVVLSGEGADELLGGYPTYLGHKAAEQLARAPAVVRHGFARLVNSLPVSDRKVSLEFLLKRFVRGIDLPWPERHVQWFGTGGGAALDAAGATDWLAPLLADFRDLDARRGPMLFDYLSYLRDHLLVKMDRATMLNSIEGRAPFLDRSLSEFALTLPPEFKVRGGTTKWLLKRAAAAWLPRNERMRRKRGLSVPIAAWINGALQEPTSRLLDPARLNRHGLLNAAAVQQMLLEHRSGRRDHARALWTAIMLQLWLERWQPGLEDDRPLGDFEYSPQVRPLAVQWPEGPSLAPVGGAPADVIKLGA